MENRIKALENWRQLEVQEIFDDHGLRLNTMEGVINGNTGGGGGGSGDDPGIVGDLSTIQQSVLNLQIDTAKINSDLYLSNATDGINTDFGPYPNLPNSDVPGIVDNYILFRNHLDLDVLYDAKEVYETMFRPYDDDMGPGVLARLDELYEIVYGYQRDPSTTVGQEA